MRISTATKTPIYASMLKVNAGIRSGRRTDTSTAPVDSTSESESVAVASMTGESIFFPTVRFRNAINSLTNIDPINTKTATHERSGGSGVTIFSIDSLSRSTPMTRIRNETVMDAIYSILACPNGCSRSAGFAEMRNEISEISCDPASDRLLIASARIATDPNSVPTANFPPNSRIFRTIPVMLTTVPLRWRFCSFIVIPFIRPRGFAPNPT